MEIDEIDEAMANLIIALDNLKSAYPLVSITANEYVDVDNGFVSTQLPTEEEFFKAFLMAESCSKCKYMQKIQMGKEALELAKKNF